MARARTVVIGVGSPHGDDAVGWRVVDVLATRIGRRDDVRFVTLGGDPARLIDAWEGASLAVVVDGVVVGPAPSPESPGNVLTFEVAIGDATGGDVLPDDVCGTSTHGLGVSTAVELARVLGRMPDRLVVVGIVIESGAAPHVPREGLSPPVEAAVGPVADAVRTVAGLP